MEYAAVVAGLVAGEAWFFLKNGDSQIRLAGQIFAGCCQPNDATADNCQIVMLRTWSHAESSVGVLLFLSHDEEFTASCPVVGGWETSRRITPAPLPCKADGLLNTGASGDIISGGGERTWPDWGWRASHGQATAPPILSG